MLKTLFSLLAVVLCCLPGFSQTKVIPLWESSIPGEIRNADYKEQSRENSEGVITGITHVSTPEISIFKPEEEKSRRTGVVVFSGGGYSHLSIEKEGKAVARWLNEIGITAFVVKYRLPNDTIMENKAEGPLLDARQAVKRFRENAAEYGVDPQKIGVMGFSAGGHLAASVSNFYDENKQNSLSRPDFSILVYPVISLEEEITHKGSRESLLGKEPSDSLVNHFSLENAVHSRTPATFLTHASDDKAVPVEHSLRYYRALLKNDIPAEMHSYQSGGHGFGLGNSATNTHWPEALERWLKENVFQKEPLLFSSFRGNGEDGLHLAYSFDGKIWRALNDDKSFLKPELGKEKLMRDPCIIKGGDGKYHMVWTVGWTEKGIGYASSEDLINWSEQQYIPVMEHEKGARNTWAPEITYDKENDEYMIYWATTIEGEFPETQSDKDSGYNHRMYYTTTKNYKEFTPTQLLYEPGFNVIDATIKKDGSKYVMFLKDETREPAEKNLKVAFSDSLTGPYGDASEPITGDYWAEGPTATKIDGTWWVYFDKYIDHQYGAVKSRDLKNWEDVSDHIIFPSGTRHGSVLKVSEEILNNLKRK